MKLSIIMKRLLTLNFILILTVCVTALGSGCSAEKQSVQESRVELVDDSTGAAMDGDLENGADQNNDGGENQTDGKEFQPESFEGEMLQNYPEIVNIVKFMGVDPKTVIVLNEDASNLYIAYSVIEPADANHEYIRLMEENGFEFSSRDATISSTIYFENDNYLVELTMISDLELYRELHTDRPEIEILTGIDNKLFSVTTK